MAMGRRGREKAEREFAPGVHMERLDGLYTETRSRDSGADVKRLRIAMVGQRGVPATFGGIEHHVEELGSRLVERGHEVIVYTRTSYLESPIEEYRGMRVKVLPTVDSKHLDAIVHSGVSTAAAIRERVDVIHYHAIGPGILGPRCCRGSPRTRRSP